MDTDISWSRNNTRAVPLEALPRVQTKIDAINRRALKLGVAGFEVSVSPVRLEKVKTAAGTGPAKYREMVDVTVTGPAVQVSGYRFLGRIDFEDGAVLVSPRPGEVVPARYRCATPACDHCASTRQRNCVFVFRRDGGEQHVQVGRSCLKDFMGHDPAAVLWSSTLSDALYDALDGLGGDERVSCVTSVKDILAIAAAVVRLDKGAFRSQAWARDSENRCSTASDVLGQLFPPSPRPSWWVTVTPTPEDRQRADEALAWVHADLASKDVFSRSDYEHTLVTLVEQEFVRERRISMVVSLISAYARHLGEQAERAARVDAYVGDLKQRRQFNATFAGSLSFDTSYGTLFIARFDTPEGRLVYKGSSPFWPGSMKPGDPLCFSATIKSHDDYKGSKQTTIQRVKVIEPACA